MENGAFFAYYPELKSFLCLTLQRGVTSSQEESVTPVLPQGLHTDPNIAATRVNLARRLTAYAVEHAKPGAKRLELSDGGGPLRLVIQPSGVKSWAVRYRWHGQSRKVTLGPFPELSLKDARDLCADTLTTLRKGADPASVRREERQRERKTVKALVTEYVEKWQKPRNRTWREVDSYLQRVLVARLGSRDVRDITRSDVARALNGRDRRTHNVVRAFWTWCVNRHELDASPAVAVKPDAPAVVRERLLSEDELRAFLRAVETMGEPWTSVYSLVAITLQRRSEIAEASCSEFDGALWSIPKERVKNGRVHLVPLAATAVEIVQRACGTRTRGFAFPASRKGSGAVSGFSRAKKRLDALMVAELRKAAEARGAVPDSVSLPEWHIHDLRRTGATKLAAIGHPIHVVERVLNHVSGATTGGLIAVYQRHDYLTERRAALEDWARYLQGLRP